MSPAADEEEDVKEADVDAEVLEDAVNVEDASQFELRVQPVSEKESKAKQLALHSSFGQVLRSKGFMWLAGRDDVHGEFSQAGATLRISAGHPWFAAIPEDMWGDVDVSNYYFKIIAV